MIASSLGWSAPPLALMAEALLLVVGVATVHVIQGAESGFPGWAGTKLLYAGILLLIVSFIEVRTGIGPSSLTFGLGIFSAFAGMTLFAVGAFVARFVPRGHALLLAVGWVLVYAYNLTGITPALVLPFGIAWILVGIYVVRHGERRPPSVRTPSS